MFLAKKKFFGPPNKFFPFPVFWGQKRKQLKNKKIKKVNFPQQKVFFWVEVFLEAN